MWCRSAPRPSFPRTPIELQQCFRLPRRQWQRFAADEAGEAYLAECRPPDGSRCPLTAARVADTPRPGRCRLADYADAPPAGSRSRRRRGPCSTGPGPSRCVIGWRARPETFAARPETFAARGFSDLRAGFVLRDESSRRQRSRAPHGSGHAAPEHDAGSPALGTRPQPLEMLRSTNWARISEEAGTRGRGDAGTRGRGDAGTRGRGDAGTRGRGDAGTRGRGDAGTGKRQRVTRRHLGAYLDELIFRSNRRHNLAVAFGALLALGAMREPTTYDTITGASDIPRISCTPKAEADWQVDAAHEVPSAGHDISYFPGGNRTGTPRGMARWASEFRSMSCSCQVHLRRAHVIPSRLARPASSFGPRVNRVQDTAAPGARSVR
jgi:hypothetical protein